jgi:HAD superfamily hydrolase (TIGR01509 family)
MKINNSCDALLNDFELFIFDWDGTLSTSTSLVKLSRIFKFRYSLQDIERKRSIYIKRGRVRLKDIEEKTLVPDGLGSVRHAKQFYSILYDLYSAFSKPRLRPKAAEILDLLARRRKKIALFSDSKMYRLLKETRELGVADKFNFILSGETAGAYKPDPTGILMIAERLGVRQSKCIYIGDMASDVMVARFAGFASCAVGGGVDGFEYIKKANPDFLFPNTARLFLSLKASRAGTR